MNYLFIGYKGCSTCTKAQKHLKDHKISYVSREITEDTPTVAELKVWISRSGLDTKAFFNTRGGAYRELNLKETYDDLTELERLTLLSEDGMLIKRPLLIGDDKVLVGYKKDDYDTL